MDPVPLRRVVRMGRKVKAKGRSLQTTRIAPGAGKARQVRQGQAPRSLQPVMLMR
jgi:hypothetical protein